MRSGRIGLAQNRLPVTSRIEDVGEDELTDFSRGTAQGAEKDAARRRWRDLGMQALAEGAVAAVSLAGGAGSRWTHGAGVVKALHPFSKLGGRHRSFIEIHLAKSRQTSRLCGVPLPHIITTSYLTHDRIEAFLRAEDLRLCGAYSAVARSRHRPAYDADGARPALCLGGDAAAVAG